MADHSCEWPYFPSSLDEAWTCPGCGVVWSAFDGRTLIPCPSVCREHKHIGWTATTKVGGQHGH